MVHNSNDRERDARDEEKSLGTEGVENNDTDLTGTTGTVTNGFSSSNNRTRRGAFSDDRVSRRRRTAGQRAGDTRSDGGNVADEDVADGDTGLAGLTEDELLAGDTAGRYSDKSRRFTRDDVDSAKTGRRVGEVTGEDVVADRSTTGTEDSSPAAAFFTRYAPDPEDERTDRIRKYAVRNGATIVAVLVAVVVALIVHGSAGDRSKELADQDSDIKVLEQELALSKSQVADRSSQVIRDATGGIDMKRKATDDDLAARLFSQSLTWSNLDDYLANRDTIVKDFKLKENGQFLSEFMPPELAGLIRTAPDGTTYRLYDADLRSDFTDMTSYISGVDGDSYTYFTVIRSKGYSDSNTTSQEQYSTATYTVTGEGAIQNLHADTTAMPVEKTS